MQNQHHNEDSYQLQLLSLQKQADELAQSVIRHEFNVLMAFHHAPHYWIPPLKIICLLITNKTLNISKFVSNKNQAQSAKFNENQLFNYFRKNTLGNSKRINDLLKQVNTASITNDIFFQILQVKQKQIFQGIEEKLKLSNLQIFKIWQWSKVLIEKLKIQRKH